MIWTIYGLLGGATAILAWQVVSWDRDALERRRAELWDLREQNRALRNQLMNAQLVERTLRGTLASVRDELAIYHQVTAYRGRNRRGEAS